MRPFARALVAVEKAAASASAMARLREVLDRLVAEFVFIHVVFRSTSVAANELDGAPANPEEIAIARDLRSAAVSLVGDRGRDAPVKILHGDPGERICEYAEYSQCDLIVLGPREKASLAKKLRGSVSKYVVGNTPRTVLVIGD
jgi:nucleotide-binding universal stress UspA family protein